jgi:autotransporter translocation and assembly factor TamB
MGFIECREGYINFSDKQFDLIKARLVFNNKFIIEPIMNIESESFIKNYRIKFNIKGTSSRPKPELQSSPPLPPRDILTLISLGELFERPTSAELTSQIGTGTAGLIASGLTDQIKKRTKKIFGNYMLKIDPNISNIAGASFEDTSRLIVGKEISKDFLIVYATNFNFSSQRQQVIYLQYHLSPSISLIGMRNEERELSLDIRFRKRQ